MKKHIFIALLCLPFLGYAQQATSTLSTNSLDEVVLSSSRIALPLKQHSRSIQVIGRALIEKTGATNVAELLQQVSGLDIRRRGIAGMQADVYIRGGSFDQTLLLIDGVKLDDAQTGHHTLNFALPLEVIDRIEIIKGPAARIFGQNAFTGAINIVTKSNLEQTAVLGLQAGSYGQVRGDLTLGSSDENKTFIAHYSRHDADGYRYNTDFKNNNIFLKGQFNKLATPIDFVASFADRKFGANGFYALPSYVDQYEETQASLVALSSRINTNDWVFKPRIYWRRGQDEYIFVRTNPAIYRNMHITHKVGVALDASNINTLGTTGLGIDIARLSIASNNLGQRERFVTTLFAEHRFQLVDGLLDITPGIALTNYTDFGSQFFPGIDLGYSLNEKIRFYANSGYTYRIPTFTDLYYSDSTTVGNENLEVEEALTNEIGFRLTQQSTQFSIAIFHRAARNLIDYIRPTAEGLFEATNIRKVNTQGIESSLKTSFNLWRQPQYLTLGYTYLDDDVKAFDRSLSRYSINSLRHHFTLNLMGNITNNISSSFAYKLGKRPNDAQYNVLDFNVQWQLKKFSISFAANNIFNEVYSESNQVPMPLGNGLLGLHYGF